MKKFLSLLILTFAVVAGCGIESDVPPAGRNVIPLPATSPSHVGSGQSGQLVLPPDSVQTTSAVIPSPTADEIASKIAERVALAMTRNFDERLEEIEKRIEELKNVPPSSPHVNATVEPSRVPPNPATAPVVLVCYPLWCPPCVSGAAAIHKHDANGVVKFEYVTDQDRWPPFLKRKMSWGAPVLWWKDEKSPTGATFQTGWGGLPALLQAMGLQPKQVAAPAVPTRVHYPVRPQAQWWYDNNQGIQRYVHWSHLDQAEHYGRFDPTWLSQLSFEELQSLHTDEHQGRTQWGYVVRPRVQAQQQQQYQQQYQQPQYQQQQYGVRAL